MFTSSVIGSIADSFDIACGTMPGREHVGRNGLLNGKSNQDGFTILKESGAIIAVVTDGCGSQAQSEVGAKLGARFLATNIAALLRRNGLAVTDPRFWERVRLDLISRIRVLALELAGDRSLTDTIAEYFLFTSVIAVVTAEHTVVVGIGDGLVCLNGTHFELGPYPENKPPYIAYGAIETEFDKTPELLKFKEVVNVKTTAVKSLLIATDGALHLRAAAHRPLPGRIDTVGDISNLWRQDRFFRNRDALRRFFAIVNSSVTYQSPGGFGVLTDEGLLPDDTTAIVIRRKETP